MSAWLVLSNLMRLLKLWFLPIVAGQKRIDHHVNKTFEGGRYVMDAQLFLVDCLLLHSRYCLLWLRSYLRWSIGKQPLQLYKQLQH